MVRVLLCLLETAGLLLEPLVVLLTYRSHVSNFLSESKVLLGCPVFLEICLVDSLCVWVRYVEFPTRILDCVAFLVNKEDQIFAFFIS